MDIHDRIKAKRIEKGMSMEQLAAACGLKGYQSVQQWEKPEGAGGTAPNRKRLDLVAAALDVTPQWLQFGDEEVVITGPSSEWPFESERWRFDRLPEREKLRASRALKDIIETWEAEHASEVKKAG